MILVLIVGQSVPHMWFKICPVTLLLRPRHVLLPVWMQKCRYPMGLLMVIFSPILVLHVTAGQCPLLRGNSITPITPCPRGHRLLFSQLNSVKDIVQDLQNIGIPAHGINYLFAGWEVRTVKKCDRGLENDRGHSFLL